MARSKKAIDLCCGRGGWTKAFLAAGFHVVGVDIVRHPSYPRAAEFVLADVRRFSGAEHRDAVVVLASPPCDEFSRHDQPWTRCLHPPPPDLSLVDACRRIAREAETPLILENVRGAQRFIGTAARRWGPFYLWGDGCPPYCLTFPKSPCVKKKATGRKSVTGARRFPQRLRMLSLHFTPTFMTWLSWSQKRRCSDGAILPLLRPRRRRRDVRLLPRAALSLLPRLCRSAFADLQAATSQGRCSTPRHVYSTRARQKARDSMSAPTIYVPMPRNSEHHSRGHDCPALTRAHFRRKCPACGGKTRFDRSLRIAVCIGPYLRPARQCSWTGGAWCYAGGRPAVELAPDTFQLLLRDMCKFCERRAAREAKAAA